VYESIGYDTDDQGRMHDAVANGSLLPLTGLTGSFPTRQDLFYLSYAEAVAAVDFFVHTYGQAHLVQLIRSYAQGVTDDEAFKAAAGVDVAGFQAAWLASLRTSPPAAYGPRQPAAGSLPPGWSQSGGGAATSALPTTAPVQAPGGVTAPAGGRDAVSVAIDEVTQSLEPVGAIGGLVVVILAVVILLRRRALARRRWPPGGPPPGVPYP